MRSIIVRLFTLTALLTALLAAMPSTSSAVNVFQPCTQGADASAVCTDVKSQKGANTNPVVGFIKVIIHVVALVVGIASVIIIVVSGLRLVSSAGDAQAAASARNGVMYAAVGIIIVILSEALVAFVLNRLQ